MVKKRSKKIPTANHPDQAKKKRGCTRRDIVMGFWIGLAGAAIYVNTKRRPVIAPKEEQKTVSTSSSTTAPVSNAGTDAPQSGLSAIPLTSAAEPAASAAKLPDPATTPATSVTVASSSGTGKQRDFLEIGKKTGTDKVWGHTRLEVCLKEDRSEPDCPRPDEVQPKCRVLQGHFYDTLYNKWLGPYSTDETEPFQFLEIGHFKGSGFAAYKEFLPRAETHSIEIACIEPGPREEGKWPYPNFPKENPKYQEYLDTNQLHCGDGSDYDFLHETWTKKMKRPDAPPLKVVVEDASHLSDHMAKSLLFWFPKIEPGGILVVEDVQPISDANAFRIHVVSQVLKDLHYCGDPKWPDKLCFPTIQPLLQSVHCEMHICVFERNEMPAVEYGQSESIPPANTLDGAECLLRSTPV